MKQGLNSINLTITATDLTRQAISSANEGFKGLNNALKGNTPLLQSFSKEIDATNVKLVGMKANLIALGSAYGHLQNAANAMKFLFGGAYEYATMMESNAIGISGILKSMTTLNGKTLEWNQAMGISSSIMSKLRVEALKTSATSKDLIDTFRALLGPGLGAGMTIDEIVKFTSVGVNAVRSMGLPANQYIQELRGLEQGGLRASSSTLATSLGLTDKDIKEAKASSEGLFKFLMDRLEGFAASNEATSKSVVGRIAILQEGVFSSMEKAGNGLYQKFSDWLKEITNLIYIVNEEAQVVNINPKFIEGMEKFTSVIETWAGRGGFVFKALINNAEKLSDTIAMAFNFKMLKFFFDSGVKFIADTTSRIGNIFEYIKGSSTTALERIDIAYQKIADIRESNERIVQLNKDLNSVLKSIDGGLMSMEEKYVAMGVGAEKAAEMQQRINQAINEGKSLREIDEIIALNEQEAIKLQKENESVNAINRQNQAEKEFATLLEKIQKLREKEITQKESILKAEEKQLATVEKQIEAENKKISSLNKQKASTFENAFNGYYKQSIDDLETLKRQANEIASGERTINSIIKLEERLVKLGMDRAEAQKNVASIMERIKEANFENLDIERKNVNKQIKNLEKKAQEEGLQRRINQLKKEALADFQKDVEKRAESKKESKSDKNSSKRVDKFLNGKLTYSKDNVETAFTDTQIAKGKEIRDLLVECGVAEEVMVKMLAKYVNLLSRGKTEGAAQWEQSIKESAQEYAERIKNINAIKDYNASIEQVRLSYNRYGEEMKRRSENEKILWIDASNNLDLYRERNFKGAEYIAEAWSQMFSQQNSGFQKQENQIKAILALEKELAAGHIDSAYAMAQAYKTALADMQSGVLTSGIDKEIEEANNKIIESQKKKQEIHAKTEAEIQAVTERTEQRIKSLNEAYEKANITRNELLQKDVLMMSVSEQNCIVLEAERNAIEKCEKSNQKSIEKTIADAKKEAEAMRKTGLEGSEAYEKLMIALSDLAKASAEDCPKIVNEIKNITKACEDLRKEQPSFREKCVSALSTIGSAAGSLGMAYQMLFEDGESCLSQMADWAIKGSIVISAAESMIPVLDLLSKGYDKLAKSAAIVKLVELGLFSPASLLAIAGGAAAIGGGVLAYNHYKNNGAEGLGVENGEVVYYNQEEISKNAMDKISKNSVYARMFEKEGSTSVENEMWLQAQEDKAIDEARKKSIEKQKALTGNLETRYPKADATNNKASKEAEKQAKKISDAIASYKKLGETINIANGELTYSYTEFDKQLDESKKKALEWGKTLKDAIVNSGGKLNENGELVSYGKLGKEAYDKMTEAIQKYLVLKERDVELQKRSKEISNSLQHNQNIYDLGETTQEQLINVNRNILEEKKKLIEEEMILYQNNATKRVELEKQLADTIKEIRNNDMYDMKTAWKAALTEISLQQVNFGEGIKSVFSSIQSAGVTLLSSTASFSEKIAAFFDSITQSILENMAKMIMQGLITNAILSIFGMGKVDGINLNSNTSLLPSNHIGYSDSATNGIKLFASGGYASGWSIVGEQGPELVNFSNPARVYTAQQTANALSKSNGSVNIKIDLKNESGTQLQAEQTGTTFDGENYVIGVVMKAISTNKNGIRTVLRGV